jgi:sialate O-acetylesterase
LIFSNSIITMNMRSNNYRQWLIVICIFAFQGFLFAGVRLPKIIGSNMVLQRNQECRIWGWADPGEKVSLEFNEVKKITRAHADGTWNVTLPAMKAGGPYKMVIEGAKDLIELDGILVGDVWICSGQSNMVWPVERLPSVEEDTADAQYSGMRLFTVPRTPQNRPADDIPSGEWMECTPANVLSFSSVGFFFGKEIHNDLRIPVGLVSTNWGGTNVETWTSGESIRQVDGFAERVDALPSLDTATGELHPNRHPSLLFNGMVHPLLNYRVTGVIWYQGESNARRAFQYRQLFPLMIEDWRKQWEFPDMPFLFVQLANFRAPKEEPGESDWAELREAQCMALELPATGMAVAIDIGEADDIHPRNKQDVGKRLALSALKIAYGKELVHSGPVFREMAVEGQKVILHFDHSGSGLMVKDPYGYLKGFTVAGPDRIFYWARAELKDDKVIVYADKVNDPVAVRYGWADNPHDVNLYNLEGLPASPFRTDDWPGITVGKVYE